MKRKEKKTVKTVTDREAMTRFLAGESLVSVARNGKRMSLHRIGPDGMARSLLRCVDGELETMWVSSAGRRKTWSKPTAAELKAVAAADAREKGK